MSSPGADACADCGGRLRRIGEDVTEELEYVPGRFIVNRTVRPRLTCACCERFVQAPLPSRPIERGRPGPGLLAHVLVSKYADHLPLHRQSQIFYREGLDLDHAAIPPEGVIRQCDVAVANRRGACPPHIGAQTRKTGGFSNGTFGEDTSGTNTVDPLAWLADTIARIPDYKITKVDDLLPWRCNR